MHPLDWRALAVGGVTLLASVGCASNHASSEPLAGGDDAVEDLHRVVGVPTNRIELAKFKFLPDAAGQ